jgi:hypothetical protein
MHAPIQAGVDSKAIPKAPARAYAQKQDLLNTRPEAVAQRELAEMMSNSPRVLQLFALSKTIHNSPRMAAQRREVNALIGMTVQPPKDGAVPAKSSQMQPEVKPKNAGLPDQVKSEMQPDSDMSMDHVKARCYFDKPAQLQSHASYKGDEIHLGAGQERHLPNGAGHVVQQAQGRRGPKLQMKAGAINDAAVAQLTLTPPFKAPAEPNANRAAIAADAQAIDVQTDLAYTNTLNRLNDIDNIEHAQFPGVSVPRFTHFAEVLQRGNDGQKAMATGYIIEDQVTYAVRNMESVTSQVAHAGARPDFVIKRPVGGMAPEKGIVDLTSSTEFGHVMDKEFSPASYTWIWESLYTKIDFDNVGIPVFNAVTQEQVLRMRRFRANRALSQDLFNLGRQLEGMSEGVGRDIDGFGQIAGQARARLTAARAQFNGGAGPAAATVQIPAATIVQLDQDIAHINALLNPIYQNAQNQPNLTTRIQAKAAKYGFAGNPWW